MKQNRKNLYLLVPLFIAVWGIIIFQIVDGFEEKTTPLVIKDNTLEEIKFIKDTFDFSITLNYKDPFKITKSKEKSIITQRQLTTTVIHKKVKQIKEKQVKNIFWPTIKFSGLVKSSNNKQVALLSISNKGYLVNEGDVIEEIKVLEVRKDSVELLFNNEHKTFKK